MTDCDLRSECGIRVIKFYHALHGARIKDKNAAKRYLDSFVDVDHMHVDVVQVHRADVLSCNDNDALLVQVEGRSGDAADSSSSLLSAFGEAVNVGHGKIQRYRTGFLYNYGYFAANKSLPDDHSSHLTTFVQAYNTSAKMARVKDLSFLSAYAICRGYNDNAYKIVRRYRDETRQYVVNLRKYYKNYVVKYPALRLEEVLSFDTRRIDIPTCRKRCNESVYLIAILDAS